MVATLAELNEHLAAADAADDARRIGHRSHTVGEDFAAEKPHLLPLPAEPFDAARMLPSHRVDHKARVCVRQHHYLVPARFAGRRVTVRLGATFLEVRAAGQVIARHQRAVTKGIRPGGRWSAMAASPSCGCNPAGLWAAELAAAFARLRALPARC